MDEMTRSCRDFLLVFSILLPGGAGVSGLVGNMVSFWVLRTSRPQSDTIFLLSALSLVDFFFLIPALVLLSVPALALRGRIDQDIYIALVEKYGWAVVSFFHTSTVWLTTLVTVHRYVTVCRPNHKLTQRIRTMRATYIQLAALLVCAFIFVIPRFFEFEIEETLQKDGHHTYRKVSSNLAKSQVFQILYKNILYYLLMFVIPLFIMIVMTSRLVVVLRERKKIRQTLNVQEQSDDSVTFALVVVVIVFIICQAPTLLARLFFAVFGNEGERCGHFYFYYEPISDFFAVLNSSVNYIIYTICAPRFRSDTVALFRSCFCRKRHQQVTPQDAGMIQVDDTPPETDRTSYNGR